MILSENTVSSRAWTFTAQEGNLQNDHLENSPWNRHERADKAFKSKHGLNPHKNN